MPSTHVLRLKSYRAMVSMKVFCRSVTSRRGEYTCGMKEGEKRAAPSPLTAAKTPRSFSTWECRNSRHRKSTAVKMANMSRGRVMLSKRSEERRVGKKWVTTVRTCESRYHK